MIVKIFIYGASVDYFFRYFLVFIKADVIVTVKFYIYAFKHFFDYFVVAADRYALISVVKVIVIVGITYRQAFNNKSRQFCTFSAPLFFGIAFNKFGINICTYQTYCLFFKVLRFVSNSLFLFVNYRFCLLRCADIPHFAEGVHIKRQVIYFAFVVGNWAVNVVVKLCKSVNIYSHTFLLLVWKICAPYL